MLSGSTTPLIFAALFKPLCCRSFSVGIRPTAVGFPSSTPGVPTRFLSSTERGTPSLGAMVKKTPWARKKEERSRSFAKRGRVGGWGAYSRDNPVEPEANDQTEGDFNSRTATSTAVHVLVRWALSHHSIKPVVEFTWYLVPLVPSYRLPGIQPQVPCTCTCVPGRCAVDSCMDGAHPKMSGRRWSLLSKERTAMILHHSRDLAESQYIPGTYDVPQGWYVAWYWYWLSTGSWLRLMSCLLVSVITTLVRSNRLVMPAFSCLCRRTMPNGHT